MTNIDGTGNNKNKLKIARLLTAAKNVIWFKKGIGYNEDVEMTIWLN